MVDRASKMDMTADEKMGPPTKLPLTPFERKSLSTSTPKVFSISADASKLDTSDMGSPKAGQEISIPDAFDPNIPVGQSYVVPVSGYFCKLCHKFYNNETAAKNNHCQSQTHFDKFQKAMIAKAYSRRMKEESLGKDSQSVALSPIIKSHNQSDITVTINTSQLNGSTDEDKNTSTTAAKEEPKGGESESVLEESAGDNAATMSCYETADEETNDSQEDDGNFVSMQDSQGSDMDETKTGGSDVGESPERKQAGVKARGTVKAVRGRGRGAVQRGKQAKKV